MEIYPTRQLALFLSAFLTGALSSLLLWLFAAIRVLLGAYTPRADMSALYARPLPLLSRPLRMGEKHARRAWSVLLTVCSDVLFCLILAICATLLFYEYNDGVLRPFALVLLFFGLVLGRFATARVGDVAIAYLAFALAVTRTYLVALLLLPWRGVMVLTNWLVIRPAQKVWRAFCRARYRKISATLCRAQLSLAEAGLDVSKARKEGNRREKQKKKAPHE